MKVGVLTGGGDCPGLNQAIRGIILRSIDYGYEIVGLRDGWAGLVNGLTMPVDLKTADEIISRGGTILGSSRTNPFKNETEEVPKCMETFKNLKLDALIAIGGEDTLGVANKFYKKGLKVVGVPKTMDNDLSATDYTFGFDTATTLAVDAVERLRDTGKSHHRIMVLEVMGRHAGWVALFTGIASGADWLLIPEMKVDFDEMCSHLKKAWERKHYGIVVASEGIEFTQEDDAKQEKDSFGHIILKKRAVASTLEKEIEKRTGIETRSAVIGHMQRGGAPTLFDRMLGLRVGVKAVELIKEGKFGMMACLRGTKVEGIPLDEAVAKLKTVDSEWWDLAKVFFK
jgi:ATP-dependent phosphofructokinase / diphosphate-dependent phosphofructokinase